MQSIKAEETLYKYDVAVVADAFMDESGRIFRGGAELHLSKVIGVLRKLNYRVLVIQQGPCVRELSLDAHTDVISLSKKGGSYTSAAYGLAASSAPRIHYNQILRLPPHSRGGRRVSVTFHGTDWDVPDLRGISQKYLTPFTKNKAVQNGYRLISAGKQLLALRSGARILSVDTSLLRFAQQFVPTAVPNIVTVPNFVDLDVFNPNGPTALLPPEAAGRRVILFPRNLSVARGVPLLPEALSILVNRGLDVHLFLCGQRVPKVVNPVVEAFQEELAERGLSERVTFLGSLSAIEMASYYRLADLTIVPSMFSEGTSLSALEAMACGSPALVSNVGGLLDVAIDGWNAWVCRAEARSLADVAAAALGDSGESRRRASVAQDQVAATFGFANWERRVQQFFEEG